MTTPALTNPPATRLIWADEFTGDLSRWRDDSLVKSGRHRTGNKYIQPDGTVDMDQNWSTLPGRWAALYDKHRSDCQFIENGKLVMKGHIVETPNPYRDNFVDQNGILHPYGDNMLYTAWLTARTTITRGSIIEVCVNVSEQCMGGHRWNSWLMPINGQAYGNTVEFAEVDSPELENPSRSSSDFGHKALLKIVGGLAGDTPNGLVDLRTKGINLREGWHTFTTVWDHDGSIEFYVDGILCNSDSRQVLMEAELIIAREMNSGVKKLKEDEINAFHSDPKILDSILEFNLSNDRDGYSKLLTPDDFYSFIAIQDRATRQGAYNIEAAQEVVKPWENYSTGPKMPDDAGLTAESVIQYADLIDVDRVLVDYVRIFEITGARPKTGSESGADADPLPTPTDSRITELTEALAARDAEIESLKDDAEKTRQAVAHLLSLT